ncbi:hypothetical protein CAP35_07800 [Chitinophagaceae bacterium IBVUCB1]|nr:hypothetical protein CAP35_07800 [Chitinophagaceae bacterium IBVUCB1]
MAKIIELKSKYEGRLELRDCRRLLDAESEGYSDEQVVLIMDFLYSVASLEYELFKRKNAGSNIVDLTEKIQENAQSNTLHSCEYRRAS